MADTTETGPIGQSVINAHLMVQDETGRWVPLKSTEGGLSMNPTSGSAITSVVEGNGIDASVSGQVLTIAADVDATSITINGSSEIQRAALTGDVTASAGANATTIANDAVTFPKMQNITSDRLLGRDTAASGDVEEISVGGGVEFTGSAGIQRSALTGEVTASAGSNSTVVADNVVDMANLTTATKLSLQRKNLIINGQGAINQRVTAPTVDNTYGIDRWRILMGAATAATLNQSSGANAPTTSKWALSATVAATNNNKFGVFQVIEGIDCYAARGQTVTLSAQLRAQSSIGDVRMAILQWTSTEDAVSADPITTWGSGGAGITTFATWTALNTPANLNVTTSFAQYSVSASVSTSATNLAVFIWNDDTTTTVGEYLQISDVQLEIGSTVTPFEYRPIQQELALCQRYCWAYETSNAADYTPAIGIATGANTAQVVFTFPVPMRTQPSIVKAVAEWSGYDGVNTGVLNTLDVYTPNSTTVLPTGVLMDARKAGGAVWTAGNAFQIFVNSAAPRRLVFPAEL